MNIINIILLIMIRLGRTWHTATTHVLTVEPQWTVTSILRDRSQDYKSNETLPNIQQNKRLKTWDTWRRQFLIFRWPGCWGKTVHWRHDDHWAEFHNNHGNLKSSSAVKEESKQDFFSLLQQSCGQTILPYCHVRLLASTAAVMWKGGRTNDIALPTFPLQWHLWKGESVSYCPSSANYMRPQHRIIMPLLPREIEGNLLSQISLSSCRFSWQHQQQEKRGDISNIWF